MLEINIRVLAPLLVGKVQNVPMKVEGWGRRDKLVSEVKMPMYEMDNFLYNQHH